MTLATPTADSATAEERTPPEVRETLCGLALAAGGANVIMQLSRLPVGHGVAKSQVDSGRVDKHPIKRLRTTSALLVVAMLGSEGERAAMGAEINRAHVRVHSDPSDPVQYNAFDPGLQLWVAACLQKGALDVYQLLHGALPPDRREVVHQYGKRLGTLLQMTEDMWPVDAAGFEDYWTDGVAQIQMDDVTRGYLQGIAGLSFLAAPLGRLGRPLAWAVGPIGRFVTLGFLPQPFRDELGLSWDDRRQRRFDAVMRVAAAVTRALPRPLREFPFNLYLWDTRRRIRAGRAIV